LAPGIVEQVAHQSRGGTEGQRAHRPERSAGQPVAACIAAHDRHVGNLATLELTPEPGSEYGIDFDREDLTDPLSERERQTPETRANLDYEVAWLK
jgi:hypothetical protein